MTTNKKSVIGAAARKEEKQLVSVVPGSQASILANAATLLVQDSKGDFIPLARDLSISEKLPEGWCIEAVRLGSEIISGHAKLGGLYVELVTHFRKAKLNPKQVAAILQPLGFRKQRISEIAKVATCAENLFKQLEAREIGFRDALELSRASGTADLLQLTEGEREDAHLDDGEESGSGEAVNQSGVKKKKSAKVRADKFAKSLGILLGKEFKADKFPMVWKGFGNGVHLTATFVPVDTTKSADATK